MGDDLTGRRAIVTGGSRGIGFAIARHLADAGADVMIVSRKAGPLEAAAEALGPRCLWQVGNTGDPAAAEAAVDRMVRERGGVDILVNNAATNPYAGPTIDIELGAWNKTLEVNLTGPLVWAQACWRASMAESGGSIINISSAGAFMTDPDLGAYEITKAALVHMTQQLAAELGPKVRVNAVCPGLIRTDFARAIWEGEGGSRVAEWYPLRRLGEVDDIARAAVFLAGEGSRWTTGQALVIDGGGLVAHRPPAVTA